MTVEHCPTCGATVRIVSGDEGTSHYEPIAATGAVKERDEAIALLRKAAHRLVPLPPYDEIRAWLDARPTTTEGQ
jgi:hypothetical protein